MILGYAALDEEAIAEGIRRLRLAIDDVMRMPSLPTLPGSPLDSRPSVPWGPSIPTAPTPSTTELEKGSS